MNDESPQFASPSDFTKRKILVQAKRECITIDVDRLKNRVRDFLDQYSPVGSWVSMLSGFVSTFVAWITSEVHVTISYLMFGICSVFAYILIANAKKCWRSRSVNADTLLDMLKNDCEANIPSALNNEISQSDIEKSGVIYMRTSSVHNAEKL